VGAGSVPGADAEEGGRDVSDEIPFILPHQYAGGCRQPVDALVDVGHVRLWGQALAVQCPRCCAHLVSNWKDLAAAVAAWVDLEVVVWEQWADRHLGTGEERWALAEWARTHALCRSGWGAGRSYVVLADAMRLPAIRAQGAVRVVWPAVRPMARGPAACLRPAWRLPSVRIRRVRTGVSGRTTGDVGPPGSGERGAGSPAASQGAPRTVAAGPASGAGSESVGGGAARASDAAAAPPGLYAHAGGGLR
jgi:hypothetical protein